MIRMARRHSMRASVEAQRRGERSSAAILVARRCVEQSEAFETGAGATIRIICKSKGELWSLSVHMARIDPVYYQYSGLSAKTRTYGDLRSAVMPRRVRGGGLPPFVEPEIGAQSSTIDSTWLQRFDGNLTAAQQWTPPP